jgi:hypothetical protein
MTGKQSYDLVLIEWEDSHGVSSDWEYLSNSNPYVLVCKSVGWLIHSDKHCKVIVPHLTDSDRAKQQGCGDMTIPAAAVLRMVKLKESKA